MSENKISTSKVVFFSVKENQTKLQHLCRIVQEHFYKKEKILILVPSEDAAHYVDQLLWRLPVESVIPHEIADHPTKSIVAITTKMFSVNEAIILINLIPNYDPFFKTFSKVYDFLDQMQSEKEHKARARMLCYEKDHFKLVLQ